MHTEDESKALDMFGVHFAYRNDMWDIILDFAWASDFGLVSEMNI